MNLLTCNMMRPNFAPGMPAHGVPQKKQFHHAASLIPNNTSQNSDRHFQNPNFFNKKTLDKSAPSSYRSSSPSKDEIEKKNLLNSSIMIPETKQIGSDSMLIAEVVVDAIRINKSISTTDMPTERISQGTVKPHIVVLENCPDKEMPGSDGDDSFIVFETEEGSSDEEDCSDDDHSSSDEDDESADDEDGKKQTMVFCNNKRQGERNRQVSITESEDSFIVFGDENTEENNKRQVSFTESEDSFIEFGDEDIEESTGKEKKPKSTKKVTFAKEPDLSTVHVMIKWSFAYRSARKGLWEQFGRDNERFRFRANRFADTLNKFLQPEHRQKVYEERFKERN